MERKVVVYLSLVNYSNTNKGKLGVWTLDFPKRQLKLYLAFLASATLSSRFHAFGPFCPDQPAFGTLVILLS